MMLQLKQIFVTVGTTQFPELIETVISDNILAILSKYQCEKLVIQHGTGQPIPCDRIEEISLKFGIDTICFDYKSTIQRDIDRSNLVISHAGAGSCIEILTARKPLIVVVNDKLMHNHQTELAEQLSKDGHLIFCLPKTLANTLEDLDAKIHSLVPYDQNVLNMKKFMDHLDSLMGFSER